MAQLDRGIESVRQTQLIRGARARQGNGPQGAGPVCATKLIQGARASRRTRPNTTQHNTPQLADVLVPTQHNTANRRTRPNTDVVSLQVLIILATDFLNVTCQDASRIHSQWIGTSQKAGGPEQHQFAVRPSSYFLVGV